MFYIFPSLCLNDLYLYVVICHLPARCLRAGGGSGGSVENAGADLFNNDILKISSSFTIQSRISRNYFQVDIFRHHDLPFFDVQKTFGLNLNKKDFYMTVNFMSMFEISCLGVSSLTMSLKESKNTSYFCSSESNWTQLWRNWYPQRISCGRQEVRTWISASKNRSIRRFVITEKAPNQGLLLVESSYYRFHI